MSGLDMTPIITSITDMAKDTSLHLWEISAAVIAGFLLLWGVPLGVQKLKQIIKKVRG